MKNFEKGQTIVYIYDRNKDHYKNNGRIYTCESDSYVSDEQKEVVQLEGIRGLTNCDRLQKVNIEDVAIINSIKERLTNLIIATPKNNEWNKALIAAYKCVFNMFKDY